MRALVCSLALVAAGALRCGTRTAPLEPSDTSPAFGGALAGGSGGTGPAVGQGGGTAGSGGGPEAAPSADATSDSSAAPDAAPEPFSGPPKSCDDVGKLPGKSTCCQGAYCAGGCVYGKECGCGSVQYGCIWPELCCGGACVGAKLCEGR
jgi:hypothetical protein